MITLQEIEPVEVLLDEIKYCHVICTRCHPTITLCGAYKPVPCGVPITVDDGAVPRTCPACKKDMCPDCADLMFKDCPRCP